MSCDFEDVFHALGNSLATVANKPGVYDTVFNSFTSLLIESYPEKKDEIIASAQRFNADYEYTEVGEGGRKRRGKRRLTRRKQNKKQ